MKAKKDLIAQINQNLGVHTKVSPRPRPAGQKTKRTATPEQMTAGEMVFHEPVEPAKRTPVGTGKQAAFWLDDEDRAIFYETGMLLYSQGIKPSHNLVLRAAIRLMPRDHRLVEKVRELMDADGRKLRHVKKPD